MCFTLRNMEHRCYLAWKMDVSHYWTILSTENEKCGITASSNGNWSWRCRSSWNWSYCYMESIPTFGPTLSVHILSGSHPIWLTKSSKYLRMPEIHYMGVILIFFSQETIIKENTKYPKCHIADFNTKHSACLYVRLG